MIEIEFKTVELEHRDLISGYFRKYCSMSCERSFVNVYLWSRYYPVTFGIVESALVFKSESKDRLAFAWPAGEPENVKRALEVLMDYSRERGFSFCLYNITEKNFEQLEQLYPGRFQIQYDEDSADYVYETEKLASLSGKKLHAKRNHINKFKAVYEGRWSYEPMSADNVEDCFQMALIWRQENNCEADDEKLAEICVAMNSLRLFEELELTGGVLRMDGEVVAFTIGESLCGDTFVVHIEKALSRVPEAYAMINQQFVCHACMDYRYVNREEDTGAEGLRQAKRSYRPVFMVEKGFVTERQPSLLEK